MINSKRSPVWIDAQPLLRTWYASQLGQSIADELSLHLDTILPRIFGYQGLQVGGFLGSTAESTKTVGDSADLPDEGVLAGRSAQAEAKRKEFLYKSGIHRKIILDCPDPKRGASAEEAAMGGPTTPPPDVTADVISLPVASDTMKLVVLPHTLDFCHQPHQALREADRVLTDDGQMVIIGFNPYSLFGAEHALKSWRAKPPWNGHFFSRGRVTEWLSVLNYQVLDSTCLYLRPPVNHASLLKRMSALEKLQPWFGGVGAVYVLRARKQTIPFTRVRMQRRRQHAGVPVTGYARASNQNSAIRLADYINRKKT